MSGAAARVREAVVVTTGSFKRGSSRWPADVEEPALVLGATAFRALRRQMLR
jgi:hypothetical protein